MAADVQLFFRGMEPSPAVEFQVRRRAEGLQQVFDRVTACRVMVEASHRHHRQGKIYHARIELTVPGSRIVVNREPGEDHAHEDLHVAVRDAFDSARRRLLDHLHRVDGKTKRHEHSPIGRIARVFAERNYAFLETASGEEIYLSRNAVVGERFDKLKVGDRVRYVVHPNEGERGPQASTVVPLRTGEE